MGHSLLLIWDVKLKHTFRDGLFGLVGFCLRQFEIARLVRIQAYNAIAFSFSGPIASYVSVFLLYPLGESSWFFSPSFGVAAIFRFLLFLQGFHCRLSFNLRAYFVTSFTFVAFCVGLSC